MKKNELTSCYSEKSVLHTNYSMSGWKPVETLTKNQSRNLKAISSFSKSIGIVLLFLFSFQSSIAKAELPPPPGNDICSDASTIVCGQIVSGSTDDAGNDDAPHCETSNGTGGGVWYKFIGTGSCMTLSTCNAGTDFNTKLRVYTGDCGDLECVAGNKDDESCEYDNNRSTVRFSSTLGTQYYVLVHGKNTSEGEYELSMVCSEPLALDCPGNLTFHLNSGECSEYVNLDIEVEGNCGQAELSSSTDHSPDNNEFPIGVTEVAFELTVNNIITESCSFTVTVIENEPDENSLSCHGNINASFDENCSLLVTPEIMLSGSDYSCFEDYEVKVKECMTCDAIDDSPLIGPEYIGETLVVEVCNLETNICCWGYLTPEDKMMPNLCCVDFELSCTADTDPENISGISKTYTYTGDPVDITDYDEDEEENGMGKLTIDVELDCYELDIEDINISIVIAHENIGDLSAEIESPDGTMVQLFNTSDCDEEDADVTFNDEATATYDDFNNQCNVVAPAKSDIFQSSELLSAFDGTNASGTWTIRVFDEKENDITGQVTAASIEIESDYANPIAKDNCDGELETTYTDVISNTDCNEYCYKTITRTWCATDNSGNEKCCTQTICLKRPDLEDLVCPPDYKGMCPADPLELLWLQELMSNCASSCEDVVEKCTTSDGKTLIIVGSTACPDLLSTVYVCGSGEELFSFGGLTGINQDLYDDLDIISCTTIFNCGDPLPHPTSAPMLSCVDDFAHEIDEDGYKVPLPSVTGSPQLEGSDINGICQFYCIYDDEIVPICEGSYAVIRTWDCWDWCQNKHETCEQTIKIMDKEPPTIDCPNNIITPVGSNCEATTILPLPEFDDVCSSLGTYLTIDKDCNTCVLELLSNGKYKLSNQPLGTVVTITYTAVDGCGNTNECSFTVTPEDQTPPTPICHTPTVGLNSTITDVYYTSFDDGSYDNCAIEEIKVRRVTDCDGNDNSDPEFYDFVSFTCCDIGNLVEVEMRVKDAGGLTNICSVDVIVQDQTNPVIQCPPSKELTCPVGDALDTYYGVTPDGDGIPDDPAPGALTYLVDDNGTPDDETDDITTFIGYYDNNKVSDNCEVEVFIREEGSINACGRSLDADGMFGPIKRTYTAVDRYGNEDSCDQFINVTDPNPFNGDTDIIWPLHLVDPGFSCELSTDPEGTDLPIANRKPILTVDGDCDNVALSVPEDLILYPVNPATADYCFKIKRTWEVIDWCNIDDSGDPARFEYEQIIKIVDGNAPVLSCEAIPNPVTEGDDLVFSVSATDCTDAYFPQIPVVTIKYTIDQGNDGGLPEVEGEGTLGAVSTGSGTDFPVGTHLVTFTATDFCGNEEICSIEVTVESLSPSTFNVSGGIENEEGNEVEHVTVEVEGLNMLDITTTGDDGVFSFNLESNSNYTITPERDDNILNGVSTYDLVLISKHILQFQLLESPYKIIAADVNHSGTVSTIDMVALRKVILFIDDEFPDNTSWRFVDAEFVFPDPADPFSTSFPEVYTINGLTEDEVADFVGVKIGDVNCSSSPNDLISGDDRNAEGELVFSLSEQSLKTGETYKIDFEATDFDQVQGFQFTMNFDANAIEFNDVEARDLANISNGNFGLHKLNEGIITASWNTLEDAQTLENGKVLFTFSFTALEDGQLSDLISLNSRFTRAEAYGHQGLLDLSLQFVDETGTIATDQFELYQNQPNPFKDETVIGFYLPESGKATFKVFDISGREIKTVEGDYTKGYNEISINRSELQSSGVLYYQLESAENIASRKMVLLD